MAGIRVSLYLLSLALFTNVFAATQFYNLDLNTGQVAPDGYERTAITINGAFQAPVITANKNDRIEANVSDHITDPAIYEATSIHWHGMFQHRTATEDGTGFVTQCPLVPGNYYNYNFSTAGQTGTYWYHSHVSTQYCDNLRGPLVVYDPEDPYIGLYDVDDVTTIITVADWYHLPSLAAFTDPTILNPTPDSTLINGLGRYVGGPSTNLSVISVEFGKRYRFRLINTACFPYYNISIDNHKFTVIEADGVEHLPLTVDSLTIFPGQRYSIILDANQTIGNYWFRAIPSPAIVNQTLSTDPGLNNAILRYVGAPAIEPNTTASNSTDPLVEADMIPLVNPGAPGGSGPADVAYVLTIGLDVSNWTINGTSFYPPSVPVLLQILSGATTAQDILPPGSIIPLPPNKTVEISFPDANDINLSHPFHLHGHNFDVVKSAYQTTPNYINPPRRDVVAIYGGNVTFRFQTNNPGPWILHCHIDWHLKSGLAIVMAEDPAGEKTGPNSVIVPPAWNNLCTAFNESGLPPV
ncbi:laccase [Sistotremastrum niveocremeum HHB9708]|uniref:Laccase n=1 Tax=Sistotremastrum niveocremeum HHB9708 TaxID=1314777 RepID=A0A164S0B4_9AGAM|nr:laccase [Sistotremastrum niveocremeum HHB9708]